MSSQYLKIPIKVTPLVKKYLQTIFGPRILISAENPATLVMYAFLQKKSHSFFSDKESLHNKIKRQTKEVYLVIQKRDMYKFGIHILDKNHVIINWFFEQQITQIINQTALLYKASGKTRLQAIDDFCKIYDIEIPEDVTMDALVKNDQRYTEKIKHNKQLNEINKDAAFW